MKSEYVLTNITPLCDLGKKDIRIVEKCIHHAKKSRFGSSRRLAACIVTHGQCILWREPTSSENR